MLTLGVAMAVGAASSASADYPKKNQSSSTSVFPQAAAPTQRHVDLQVTSMRLLA